MYHKVPNIKVFLLYDKRLLQIDIYRSTNAFNISEYITTDNATWPTSGIAIEALTRILRPNLALKQTRGLFSKESAVLRWWGSKTQKFWVNPKF